MAMAVVIAATASAFEHPGISYTAADIERMRAYIAAGQQPYASAFEALKASGYSTLNVTASNRGTTIKEGKFNGTVGVDGRRAHDLALMWQLTGDKRYADKAVEYLNANSYYTNTSSRGTGPLDNGKVYLLIEAAELMRDYPGWKAADRQRFADMLVHPGYSDTEDMWASNASYDDDANDVTFYWNIQNFDASRHGNQGLFAARAMMAMGIFLDNRKMYDRACRYILGMPHRPDDLPYVSGPPQTNRNKPVTEQCTDYMTVYPLTGRDDTTEDYGYDEQLQYYIYPNGQSQESCRDQSHALVGVFMLVDIAEMAWNQGDDIYGALDRRLLTGIEWSMRYNHSYLETFYDQPRAWSPSGYVTDPSKATYANGRFLRTTSRSGRWESIGVSPDGRGNPLGQSGARECALAHYAVRCGLDDTATRWLQRSRDYMTATYGCELWGNAPNWYYEWKGWGTLTKRLEPGMAGIPGTFDDTFAHTATLNAVPGTFRLADYDYYRSGSANGHTCFCANASDNGRPDSPGLEIVGDMVRMQKGDKAIFTINVAVSGVYDISIDGTGDVVASCTGTPSTALYLPVGVHALTVEATTPVEATAISIRKHVSSLDAAVAPGGEVLRVYDLQGRPASNAATGFRIEISADGTVRKAL